MRYKSNLECPDLASDFKLKDPPLQIMNHDMPSDPDYDPNCGFLTHDEAALLYHCAKAWPYRWADIGARFGWSTAHIAAAEPLGIYSIDPILQFQAQSARFDDNAAFWWGELIEVCAVTSKKYFSEQRYIQAAMIDGDHDEPQPELDAKRAIIAGASVLVWHDFQGKPIRDAVQSVMKQTWQARVYSTPNGMAVAWRNGCGFIPPEHTPDPAIDWKQVRAGMKDFDFTLCV